MGTAPESQLADLNVGCRVRGASNHWQFSFTNGSFRGKKKKSEFDAASILQCPPAIRILHVTMILDLNDQISNKDHMRLKIWF